MTKQGKCVRETRCERCGRETDDWSWVNAEHGGGVYLLCDVCTKKDASKDKDNLEKKEINLLAIIFAVFLVFCLIQFATIFYLIRVSL